MRASLAGNGRWYDPSKLLDSASPIECLKSVCSDSRLDSDHPQAEVQYRDNYCMIGVNGTSATAGEIVCACGMVPGQVTFAIAANIEPGGGSAIAGSVTDISIDTGDGAINLQLFGTTG